MKHPVSLIALVSAAALCLSPFAIAQNSPELPSAPSATMQQQQKPAPPVAQPQPQPPAQAAPATSTAAPSQAAATSPSATPAADKATPQANTPDLTHDENDQPLETIRKRVDEVNVIFTVTDKHGHYVKDLHKDDFAVKDDNRPAQSVLSFRSETDLPLRVGLLIDASNSVRDRFRWRISGGVFRGRF